MICAPPCVGCLECHERSFTDTEHGGCSLMTYAPLFEEALSPTDLKRQKTVPRAHMDGIRRGSVKVTRL